MEVAALRRRSIEIIRQGQAPTGAYLAAPTFPPYRYSWFRDGAFVAEAMSREGEAASADAFFDWCARAVLAHRRDDHVHARYDADGEPVPGEWHTDQVDGVGLWLWALRAHLDRHGGAPDGPQREAIAFGLDYLAARRHEPCFDWWEERDGLHLATLACARAGLEAWGREGADLGLAEDRMDASQLVLLLLGYGGRELLDRVRGALVNDGGGVHRHLEDEYYGGGEWLLLKGFEGLALLRLGAEAEAREALRWIAARAEPDGSLPEQSQERLLRPDRLEPWVARWGPPASPLLWSHAMFLTLGAELGWEA